MSGDIAIREGMEVYGGGQLLGRVEAVRDDGFEMNGLRYTGEMIGRVEADRVSIGDAGAGDATAGGRAAMIDETTDTVAADVGDAPAATVARIEDRVTAQGDLAQAGVVAPPDEPSARATLAENITPARETTSAREPGAVATTTNTAIGAAAARVEDAGTRPATTGGEVAAVRRDYGAVQEDEIRIPVAEERLAVGTREVERGEVAVRKTVELEEQIVPVTLTRDEVTVSEVRVEERPATGEGLFEEGTIRVAVRGEEAVVAKEAVITGEVVIEKDAVAEERQITDTVRRQRVEVEEHYRETGGIVQVGTEVEPGYDAGFAAGGDARHAGREWAHVEPELQRDYEARGGSRDRWAELRADIRAGWDKARGR